jgi:thiamine kinase-like enzyme
MRFRFKPTSEQRTALRANLVRLDQPAVALEILRPILPPRFKPVEAVCTVQSVHPDRFVTRVQVRSDTGEEQSYALKTYSDDFVARVWEHSQALKQHVQEEGDRICLATSFLPEERLLIFPWVDGSFLSEIVDDRKPDLLRSAAKLAASLHRVPIIPERPTTVQMLFDETRARCDRLRFRWPQTEAIIEPIMAQVEEVLTLLDPAQPAAVHGDMAARQFLWTGERLVLLDLDMFGYTDPAYDVGHFLAQLERRCLVDPTVRDCAPRWLASFRETYLAEMPHVSPRNISFYRGLTLIRKIYTICRRQPTDWPRLVPHFAEKALAALKEVGQTPRLPKQPPGSAVSPGNSSAASVGVRAPTLGALERSSGGTTGPT